MSLQKRVWKQRPEILLSPPIPPPLHGVTPRSILGKAWWDMIRKEAYRSTVFHCLACGIWKGVAPYRKWLEGHEVYEIDYLLGRMTYVETVPLCHCCHNFIHSGRLKLLVEEKQIPREKYNYIMQRGNKVLSDAGLKNPIVYNGPCADWDDWRLVLFEKEYPNG